LIHRLPVRFVRQVLEAFNARRLDAAVAMEQLDIKRTQLYDLRSLWLRNRRHFNPKASGGNHYRPWPVAVLDFLEEFVPLQRPPNYQLIADELRRRFEFARTRSALAHYLQTQRPHWLPAPAALPRPRRRWQCAQVGELWHHDSSIHAWWPSDSKPILLLTIDDHSRKLVGGQFVPHETVWAHFVHFRASFEEAGLPSAVYTDALSVFGHTSTRDLQDPHSQFQRALLALDVAHRVAPSPQAKGKIERRFGTLQRRLVTLLAFEQVTTYSAANEVLGRELQHQNQTVYRTTGLSPNDAWDKAQAEGRSQLRPTPPDKLLDLHLALHLGRRVNTDHTIDFLGRAWDIGPTTKKIVTLIHHPKRAFWVVPHPPQPPHFRWPEILARYSL
jgi:hypothetical protein